MKINVICTVWMNYCLGCFVGTTFMCDMCYADDLTIIAPSLRSMEIMLPICEDFALEYQVTFNSTKVF